MGESVSLPFPASRVGLYSWVHGSFLHFQSQKSSIFSSLSASVIISPSLTLILPLFYKGIAITSFGHISMTQDNFPHVKISNLITSAKTFLLYNVQYSQVQGLGCGWTALRRHYLGITQPNILLGSGKIVDKIVAVN